MSRVLLTFASHLYAAAAVLYVVYFVRANAKVALVAGLAMGAGFLVHTGNILQRFVVYGYTPITNFSEGLSFLGWLLVAGFLLLVKVYRLPIIGAFVGPLVVLVVVPALLMRPDATPVPEAVKIIGMPVHVVIAFAGLAAFALATGAAVMYLVLERQMKGKRFGMLFDRLPSLEVLDEMNGRLMRWGFVALSLTLVSGSFFAKQAWGAWWRWDPKLTLSLVSWLVFAALVHARLFVGWRGRRVAWLTMLGFAVLFGSFVGLRIFPAGLHTGAYQ